MLWKFGLKKSKNFNEAIWSNKASLKCLNEPLIAFIKNLLNRRNLRKSSKFEKTQYLRPHVLFTEVSRNHWTNRKRDPYYGKVLFSFTYFQPVRNISHPVHNKLNHWNIRFSSWMMLYSNYHGIHTLWLVTWGFVPYICHLFWFLWFIYFVPLRRRK